MYMVYRVCRVYRPSWVLFCLADLVVDFLLMLVAGGDAHAHEPHHDGGAHHHELVAVHAHALGAVLGALHHGHEDD